MSTVQAPVIYSISMKGWVIVYGMGTYQIKFLSPDLERFDPIYFLQFGRPQVTGQQSE